MCVKESDPVDTHLDNQENRLTNGRVATALKLHILNRMPLLWRASMIIFLFGLPGVGKTYVGQYLSRELDYTFWDGDDALSADMKEYIR